MYFCWFVLIFLGNNITAQISLFRTISWNSDIPIKCLHRFGIKTTDFVNSFGAKFQTTFVVYFFFFFLQTVAWKEVYNYVKLKDWMSNSVDPDETAHYEPSHLNLCCLQKPIIIALGSERVNLIQPLPLHELFEVVFVLFFTEIWASIFHANCLQRRQFCFKRQNLFSETN